MASYIFLIIKFYYLDPITLPYHNLRKDFSQDETHASSFEL